MSLKESSGFGMVSILSVIHLRVGLLADSMRRDVEVEAPYTVCPFSAEY